MSLCVRLCLYVLLLIFVSCTDCLQQSNIYSLQKLRSPRDWEPQSAPRVRLRPRMEVLSGPRAHGRTFRHTVAHATGNIRNYTNNFDNKLYRGRITTTVIDTPKVKRRGRGHRRHLNTAPEHRRWKPYARYRPQKGVCARCPSDRAVLAQKGSTSVLMETPPVIPCYPWSSVKKVKSEVMSGPQPGDRVPEGSHKIIIRLYRHRRTLATCVTRYNVIVRKCGELAVGPGVKVDCPLGKAWGAHCNISCQPGYQLEGDPVTLCADDLEWTGATSHCIPTTACPVPITPAHGQLSCRTPRHQPVHPQAMLPDGSQCHYLCDPGYSIPPAQQHLANIHCVAGTWDSQQDPTCLETNELEDEDSVDIAAEDTVSFDSKECPEGWCLNGGLCLLILGEPLCSCKTGHYGSRCQHNHSSTDGDDTNDIL